MKRRSPIGLALLTALASSACDGGSVRRYLTLGAVSTGLPHATTYIAGAKLRVEVGSIEPLKPGFSLVAWAREPSGWARLGPVSTATPASFERDFTDVEEIVLSQEGSASSTTTPGLPVFFRGRPDGALRFGGYGGPDNSAFNAATATVDIIDQQISIRHQGLPPSPQGTTYVGWLRARESHEHGAHVDPAQLGRIGNSETDEFTTTEIATRYEEVVITIELDSGASAMADDTVIMRGTIPTDAGEESATEKREPGHSH